MPRYNLNVEDNFGYTWYNAFNVFLRRSMSTSCPAPSSLWSPITEHGIDAGSCCLIDHLPIHTILGRCYSLIVIATQRYNRPMNVWSSDLRHTPLWRFRHRRSEVEVLQRSKLIESGSQLVAVFLEGTWRAAHWTLIRDYFINTQRTATMRTSWQTTGTARRRRHFSGNILNTASYTHIVRRHIVATKTRKSL